MTAPIRILVVDDHPIFREGICTQLEAGSDIDVVGQAANGDDAVAAAAALAPELVLMDLNMPGAGGIEATGRILRAQPRTRVLVLTMYEDDDMVFAALRAGARGYLLKDASGAEILQTVRAVARGDAVFGPRIADRVIRFFAAAPAGSPAATPFPQLTGRERDVLDLVARGLDNSAIARRLCLSDKTVRNRVSDVLVKLSATSRAEAVAVARDAGLGAGA